MLTPILSRQDITLNAATPLYSSPIIALDPDAAEIVVVVQRPTTAVPLAWTASGQIQVTISVMVDGVQYRAVGRASGGVRAGPVGDMAAYRLTYTLPVRLGQRARDYIAQSTRDAEGFYSDVPLDRVGRGATTITAQVSISRLRGSITTSVLVAEADSQPAPTVRTKNSVAFDAATSAKEDGGDGVLSLSHTAAGSDRAAFAGVGWYVSGSGDASTSASYGGTGMTELWDFNPDAQAGNAGYRLHAPATGAQTVISTLGISTDIQTHILGVVSFTGVDQTTPVGTPNTAFSTTGNGTVTVASVGADDMVVENYLDNAAGTPTIGADQTQRNTQTFFTLNYRQSTQPGTAGGVMSWTTSGVSWWGIGAVAFKAATSVSAALTGTAAPTATESEIVAGGQTIILTLTGDTWVVAAGSVFDGQRQNIIDGIDSAQSETDGWDAERSNLNVTNVVRTSDTIVTITLGALAGYAITATETLTATIPSTATLLGLGAVVASPTFQITPDSSGSKLLLQLMNN
jgi:hypothetical protein